MGGDGNIKRREVKINSLQKYRNKSRWKYKTTGGNNISKYFSPASSLCLLKHHSLLKLPPSRKVER